MDFQEQTSTESGESAVALSDRSAVDAPSHADAVAAPQAGGPEVSAQMRMRLQRSASLSPIPSPEKLEKYEGIRAGSADDVFRIWESRESRQTEAMRHHIQMDKRSQDERELTATRQFALQRNGQFIGMTIVLAALGVVAFGFSTGVAGWSVAIAVLMVVALLAVWKSQVADPMTGLTDFTKAVVSIAAKQDSDDAIGPDESFDPTALPEPSTPEDDSDQP